MTLPIATLKEAAVRLGVSTTYLRHQASPEFELRGFQGPIAVRLGARKIGRDWYVDREAPRGRSEAARSMSPARRLGTELEAHTLALAKDEQKRDAWAARYVRLAATLEAERKRHHALLRALRVRGQWFAEESAPFVVCRIPRAFFDAIPDLDAGDGTAPVSRGTIQ